MPPVAEKLLLALSEAPLPKSILDDWFEVPELNERFAEDKGIARPGDKAKTIEGSNKDTDMAAAADLRRGAERVLLQQCVGGRQSARRSYFGRCRLRGRRR